MVNPPTTASTSRPRDLNRTLWQLGRKARQEVREKLLAELGTWFIAASDATNSLFRVGLSTLEVTFLLGAETCRRLKQEFPLSSRRRRRRRHQEW